VFDAAEENGSAFNMGWWARAACIGCCYSGQRTTFFDSFVRFLLSFKEFLKKQVWFQYVRQPALSAGLVKKNPGSFFGHE
jgi:hypothetical protein